MSFNPKISNNEHAKCDRFTWKKFVDLIGAGPNRFCYITAPAECRGEKNVTKECQEIFQKCLKEARRDEMFSRSNY